MIVKRKAADAEAMQWTGQNQRDMFDFLTNYEKTNEMMLPEEDNFVIDMVNGTCCSGNLMLKTPIGEVLVNINDWVVKEEGKFFSCSAYVFEQIYTRYEMVEEKSWKAFRESGLLWWINRILHTFGWAIVIEIDDEKITNAYPARVKYRGFDSDSEERGFKNISKYLKENIEELEKEANE